MRIDPNNHRLINYNLLYRPENPHNSNSSATATSSGSKVPAATNINPPVKSRCDNDQVSDAASFLEDEPCSQLPDLNLDFTISISATSVAKLEDQKKNHKLFNISRDLDFSSSPTHVLFG